MIAKLINGYLRKPTERIIPLEDGCTITDPTDETLVELLGYKYVIETTPPEIPDGFYLDIVYREDDENIYKEYELKEYSQPEPIYQEPVMSEEDIFTAILLGKDV